MKTLLMCLAMATHLVAPSFSQHGFSQTEEQCDADRQRAFDWTVGLWRGTRLHLVDQSKTPMTMRVETILGGAGQVQHIEIGSADELYRGFAVQVYEPGRDHWVRQYVNSVHGKFVKLDGEILTDRSIWRTQTPAAARLTRLDSEQIDNTRWRRTMSFSDDGGENWTTIWIDDLQKLPSGSSKKPH